MKKNVWTSSKRLQGVNYEIRGTVLREAIRLESEGAKVLRLNIGNTAPFGLMASASVIEKMAKSLETSQGYCHSHGETDTRHAIANYYRKHSIALHENDVYLGNGVSELIQVCMLALLDPGDEILLPRPDYPLWTAAAALCDAKISYYYCDESNSWNPDVDDIRKKITKKTKALVLINPNNPTGAVYTRETLQEIARVCMENEVLIFADEIYEKIVYDGAKHHFMAPFTEDFPCVFFGGLSKAFRMPGFRCGWMGIKDPNNRLADFRKGIEVLSSMRLCSNTPPQSIVAHCLHGDDSIQKLIAPGGELYLRRKKIIEGLSEIEGLSFVKPLGAMYVFPKIDTRRFPIVDDEQFALNLLRKQHVLVVQGSGFHWPTPDHFRIVMLPDVNALEMATRRIKTFLEEYISS